MASCSINHSPLPAWLVKGAPEFDYPAYAMFPIQGDTEILTLALETLRVITARRT